MVFEESVVLTESFPEVLAKVKDALAAEGFGVLTEIDVQATLAAKLGKQIDQYAILGACNPGIAARALDLEPQIGVLLPCNVVVRRTPVGVLVEALDPGVMATLVGNPDIQPVADDARASIGSALNRLSPTPA